jgi:hypothetical protein
MTTCNLRTVALLSLLASVAACTGDSVDTGTVTDTGADTSGSGQTDTGADTSGSGQTDTGADTTEPEGYDIPRIYFECETTSQCPPDTNTGAAQRCINNVCLISAADPAALAEEDQFLPLTDLPNVDCYGDDATFFAPGAGDATAKLRGNVQRFGSGSQPINLCVSHYNETLLLPFLYFSECRGLEADDEAAFIACFQLDACRCDNAFGATPPSEATEMVAAAEAALTNAGAADTIIDSLEKCYAFIGNCTQITDAGIKAACEQRLVDNALADGPSTLIYSHTISVADPADPTSDEEAYYETAVELPTNTRMAIKVSGRESRWRDTWEYGLFTPADLKNAEGFIRLGANTVSDGAWRTIPPAVGLAGGIDDTHGAIAGTIRDCGDPNRANPGPQRIVNATVGISFDGDSKLSYFNGNPNDTLPLPGRAATNSDGTYAAIDLPSGPNRVSPIICRPGTTCSSDADFVNAGTRNLFQTPKSIVITSFEPVR